MAVTHATLPLLLVTLCRGLAPQDSITLVQQDLRIASFSNLNHAVEHFQRGLDASVEEVIAASTAQLHQVSQEVASEVTERLRNAIFEELAAVDVETPVGLLSIDSYSKSKRAAKAAHTKSKKKMEFNPFKSMIADINTAIDAVKDGLETTTKGVVHQTAQELKASGEQLSKELSNSLRTTVQSQIEVAQESEKASLAEIDAKPQQHHHHHHSKTEKKAKTKAQFNPFKGMIADINTAIDAVKAGLESSTREVVHNTAVELRSTGDELGKELSNTLRATVQGEIQAATTPEQQSLAQIDSKPAHAHHHSHKSKAKAPKTKLQFNPFKSMIADINVAIDAVKDGLESSTREVVHQTAVDLKSTGAELGKELSNTLRATVQSEIQTATAAEPASQ